MQPGPNGMAPTVLRTPAYVERPVLRTTAETIPYRLEGPDGEIATLSGYKRVGAPLDIAIAYDAVIVEHEDDAPTDADREQLSAPAYYARVMRYERMLRRGYLQAVIPGLREPGYENAVNVLAGDDGQYEEILTELGWWTPRTEVNDEDDDDHPEAVAGQDTLTGPADSLDSSPATASIPSDAASAPA